jgi:2-polyprenyl-3-methyl-5-hydroxy-6-metoxy-1,4-benzoquinol methylase
MEPLPGLDEQRAFWDEWNETQRSHGIDDFMARQISKAQRAARAMTPRGDTPPRILEVGCGTGWLAATLTSYGRVTAFDLSEHSIALGRARYSDVEFVSGDFDEVDIRGPFDLVISADTLSHVANQDRFVDRVAEWICHPDGTFLLMTQNAFVWRRSSYLTPQGRGQIRNWPSLGRLRQLLGRQFTITSVESIVPGGDLGVLRPGAWARRVTRPARLESFVRSLQERARIGRELVITARPKAVSR